MAEALEAQYLSTDNDELEWIVYDKDQSTEPFQDWLYKNLPSTVEKRNGVGWVCVRNRPNEGWADEPDLEGLCESWDAFLYSGRPVTYDNIKELALNHNVKSGKWLLFVESGGKVDHLWSVIASAIINNSLPCNSAKVSSYKEGTNHVLCIYNNDFTNYEQVMNSEQAIRQMGIKSKLLYKPDVYTHLGVYSGNPWNLVPNILISNYDIVRRTSVIENSQGISQI